MEIEVWTLTAKVDGVGATIVVASEQEARDALDENYGPEPFDPTLEWEIDSHIVTVAPPSGWTRWAEVVAYAVSRNVSVAEAIRLLVNQGLSHEPPKGLATGGKI